jgi:hypothetical protein
MTAAPAEPAATASISRLIEEAIAAGWAWAVFTHNSSDGPLATGIEVAEQQAVKRVEKEIKRHRNAAFGGITGPTAGKVCRRTTSGGYRWWTVSPLTQAPHGIPIFPEPCGPAGSRR